MGEVLRLLRIANNLSIKDLAEKTELSSAYIGGIEHGRKKNPSLEVIQKYCEALDVSVDTILYFKDKAETNKKPTKYADILIEMLQRIVTRANSDGGE